jgi:hypothetical protein
MMRIRPDWARMPEVASEMVFRKSMISSFS